MKSLCIAVMFLVASVAQAYAQHATGRHDYDTLQELQERGGSQNHNDPVGDAFGRAILGILAEQARRQSDQRKNRQRNQQYVVGRLDITALNVRRGPGLNYSAIKAIPKGANGIKVFRYKRVFDSDRSYRNWCLVQYRNIRGWSSCKYITVITR